MSSVTGANQQLSIVVKFHWILLWTAVLLACCSFVSAKPVDVDSFLENEIIDALDPEIQLQSDSNFAERALPRLGRALPRLGRALPRLGRALPRLGRALPRLGRALPRLGRALPRLGRALPRLGRALPRLGRGTTLPDRHVTYGINPQVNYAARYYGFYDDMISDDSFNVDDLSGERQEQHPDPNVPFYFIDNNKEIA